MRAAMRLRIGFLGGFALGYYLGAMAGRQRYEQINRALRRIRRSEVFETAQEKAKAAVDLGVERARDAVESRVGNGHGSDQAPYDQST
jgi:hypothetical protein